ncbi:MAG TPA: UDP-N-acetylmuramate dehydrogenase [Paludibacteraceae bacterium]|jgi:UDP-N-acetylmuramate dehydrogenase|nr:UDP-N-acetylmuramate dehydrogenase [Paludibacteraceae bacterium]MDS1031797.1 UDP-N-acetylmuramate dehydrogenase [Porphyromonadaceae sp. NP-X]NLJ20977.1 UDP-N-acetylmuramate dehydrogenase [Bacteroidales bacterium]HNZ62098.1 UDP-N-acetylmuramate dehydrogenase [Paludibacteraceae bacterium]HOH54734.1 UDP-N-acetylmuramate dehydrogenase [Paludibacteraceae bacterium]
MNIKYNYSLLSHNTFGVDVKTDEFIEFDTVEEALTLSKTLAQKKWLMIGQGSNLLFLNDFKGAILHSAIRQMKKIEEDDQWVYIEVGSGVIWDQFVEFCVENGWGGVENLSSIPGEVGAAAVQNIGAYGMEVRETIEKVKAIEIASSQLREFSKENCQYGYRQSIFKNQNKGQYILTSVVFRLSKKPQFKLSYQHLEEEVQKRGSVNLQTIRETIIQIREHKLPDFRVMGNAGSFFINPVISKKHFQRLQSEYPEIPHYYVSQTEEKIPAAWLIEQCGWKGKQVGKVAVHAMQPLVIVNCGGASGNEIKQLADEIQLSVKNKFDIQLQPEVNYIE